MTRPAIPSRDKVLAALAQLQADEQHTGRRPAVLTLARQVELANTTFRRHFPDVTTELASQAAARQQAPQPPSRCDQLQEASARLRRENRQLHDQIELAAAVIQRVTLENHHLREQLEDAAKVTAIAPRTTRSPRPPRG